MAKGRKPSGNPVERGTLGHSMMSAVADVATPASAAEQGAEPGSDLQTELQKVDRAALSRAAQGSAHRTDGERTAVGSPSMPIIAVGAAAIIAVAMFKAARRRR
jgi:hypothetical protein